jgi:putative ABC transport system permease protein
MIRHIFTLIWNKKRQNYLLLLEVFFAFLILFGVLTFVVYNLRLYQSPLGFETKNTWVVSLNIEEEADSAAVADMKRRLKREVLELPEVESASFSYATTPFSGSNWTYSNDDNGFPLITRVFYVDEDFDEAIGLNVVEGRWFNENDLFSKYKVAVITRKFKEETFGDRPVLDSVYVIVGETRIVGVIDHYKYEGEFSEEANGTIFLEPEESRESDNLVLRIREGSGAELEEKVNQLISGVTRKNDFTIESLEARRKRNSRATWIPMIAMLSVCGFLVINVSLGLFGVLWYNISKRKAEIGLRRTLGASQSSIAGQFTGEVLMITVIGILLGSFFAFQLPMMKLFDIEWINYIYASLLAAGIILLVVLICALYPSYQASLIRPAIALHEE